MARGDHIYVVTSIGWVTFQHHGIDMGDGTVIHLSASDGTRATLVDRSGQFAVRRATLEEFSKGKPVLVVQHVDRLPVQTTCELALNQVGRRGYHLLNGNCEHFATYCATGQAISRQVELGRSAASSVASAATKIAWATSMAGVRTGFARVTSRIAVKPHPLQLAADGVELIAIASSCAAGFSATASQRIARISGHLTALGIGCAVAGPAGGVAWMALHYGTTTLAEKWCQQTHE